MRYARAITAMARAAAVPFVGRQNFYAANDVSATVTGNTTWQSHSSVTFTPDANSDYFAIWCAPWGYNATGSGSAEVRLRNVTASSDLAEMLDLPSVTGVTRFPASGIARLQFGASPASTQVALEYRTGNSSNTTTLTQSRLWIVKADAADAYAEAAGPVLSEDSFTTALTLSFTPASSGDYIFLWSAEYQNTANSGHAADIRVRSGSTDHYTVAARHNQAVASGWVSTAGMFRLTGLSGSQTFTIDHKNSSGFGTDANLRRIRLLAFRESVWAFDDFNENATLADFSTNTTDQNRARLTITPEAKEHVLIGSANWEGLNTTNPIGAVLKRGGTDQVRYQSRHLAASHENSALMLERFNAAASSTNFDVDYFTTNTGTGVRINRAAVALLRTAT